MFMLFVVLVVVVRRFALVVAVVLIWMTVGGSAFGSCFGWW